jgi:hypothetical protein
MVRKRFYANILCGTDDKIHNLENQMLQQTTAKSFKTDEYRYIFFWISNLLTEGYSSHENGVHIFKPPVQPTTTDKTCTTDIAYKPMTDGTMKLCFKTGFVF